MKKRAKFLLGLLLALPLVAAGAAFANLAPAAEAVEVDAATTTYYVDYNAYSSVFGNDATLYIHAWSASGNLYGDYPGSTDPVAANTDNKVTVSLDSTATGFILNTGSNGSQTCDITPSGTADDTYVLYGIDTSGKYYGSWASALSATEAATTWNIPGEFNSWTKDATTATPGGDAVSVDVEGGQHFRMLLGMTSSWGSDYAINYNTYLNFGGTTTTLAAHYSEIFQSKTDNDLNFYLNSDCTGTLTFKFGTGLYAALLAGRDISDLLTITFASSGSLNATYVPVVTNGYYGQTDTITANTGTLISAITPELYGYKFVSWYTDRWCTQSVASDATIDTYNSSGAWLYAKFEADASTYAYTNYEFDFSEALSVYKGSNVQSIFVYYYRAADTTTETEFAEVAFPGINVGAIADLDGLISTAIPNDATNVILSCYSDAYNFSDTTKVRQTKAVSITSDNPAMVFLDGNYDSNDYDNAYAYQADAGYQTIKNALTGLIEGCGTTATGSTPSDEMGTAWETIANTTSTYKTNNNLRDMGANANANTWSIAGCLSRYDYIVEKYGTALGETAAAYNPLSRNVTVSAGAVYNLGTAEESSSYIATFAVLGIVGLATGAYLFIRKKEHRA